MYVCMYIVSTFSRVWINRVWLPILLVVSCTGKNFFPLSPFAHENLVSRDRIGPPVPRHAMPCPLILHAHAESSIINHQPGSYSRDDSRFPRQITASIHTVNRHDTSYIIDTVSSIESVPSLSSHAFAYRWRLLPRVSRHRASSPRGSSSNGC